MYFVLDRSWAKHPARVDDAGSYDRQDVWWNDGALITADLALPITMKLQPFEPKSPDESVKLPSMFKGSVPFFRDDLIAALRAGGADNLQCFDAQVIDPDDGRVHSNYKAVNIIGMMAAADMEKSKWSAPDGIAVIDVAFDQLVIDGAKAKGQLLFRLAENNDAVLVHVALRNHLIKAGFVELEFHDPGEIAL